jgi:signal transduction histidine kinase
MYVNYPFTRLSRRGGWPLILTAVCMLCWIAVFMASDVNAADGPRVTRVLIVHSFGREFAPWNAVSSGFRTELARQSAAPIEFLDASLQGARFADGAAETSFVAYLRALFADRRPDLLVSIGGPSVTFLQRHRDNLFPEVPLLIAGVDQRILSGAPLGDHATAVGVSLGFSPIVENILRILPGTTSISVVIGNSPIERFWVEELRRAFQPFTGRVRFNWLNEFSFEEMRRRFARLAPHSAILYPLLLLDAAGVSNEQDGALDVLRDDGKAPIFGIFDSQLGRGIVGGPLYPNQELGRKAAGVAIRILAGERPASIQPMFLGPTKPVYDWRELQRWGVGESRLPSGSEVRFRRPSLWEDEKEKILLVFGIVVLQSGLIGALLAQRGCRRRAEQQARALNRHLLTAHEDERRRLARDLHDDLTQRLARLAIDAGNIERSAPASSDNDPARSMREDLVRLSEDVHALSYRLHPSLLDDLGLVEALNAECDGFSRRESISVEFKPRDVPQDVPPETGLCLFRVAQESLHNVARHAGASAVEVSLRTVNGGLEMAVRDNGAGFDPGQDQARPSLGLASMKERLQLLGGELDIDSAPGQGTTVVAWVRLNGEKKS